MHKKIKNLFSHEDKILEVAVNDLLSHHKCHTVILYGSRARGEETLKSDYDLMGVRKSGKKFRFAQNRNGFYIDGFIFPEKDLSRINENHIYMKDACVLYSKTNYGSKLVQKIKSAANKAYKPLPPDELQVRRVWPYKMLERIKVGDIEAKYRRSWLHEALLSDYFNLRKKRYWGSKRSFEWLKVNDRKTYNLFSRVLNKPDDLKILKRLVDSVTRS